MKKKTLLFCLISYLLCAPLTGCGTDTNSLPGGNTLPSSTDQVPGTTPADDSSPAPTDTADISPSPSGSPDASPAPDASDTPTPSSEPESGLRDNTPHCLVPTTDGIEETHNEYASIDYSNAAEGYITARYTGECPKVKMQIKGSNSVTYTYNLGSSEYEAFPLSSGSGVYEITILENVFDTNYVICLTVTVEVTLSNEFGPYLYPNQYCSFDSASRAVALAEELAEPANTDLDVIANVYNYVITSISYDYDKAETVPSGYIPNVDAALESGSGICLDYAAVMTSMLRSQRIPTRLEVGYAGDLYHAWISTYIPDVGWVNGIVQFDGKDWELMDPTLASMVEENELRDFISDESNYAVKYSY